MKFGAGGHLSALNYTSGLARIQARLEIQRTTESGRDYRNEPVLHSNPGISQSSQTESNVLVEGRSKPFGLLANEFLFPSSVSQSTIGGRNGSNACTIIAMFTGNLFLKSSLPFVSSNRILPQWTATVVNCILDGNALYDMVFDGQTVF